MIPARFDSVDELREFVFNAHGLSVNAPHTLDAAAGIHVGILDSMYDRPEWANNTDLNIANKHRFVETDEPLTHPHGFRVFNLLSYFARDATYSFYQVVGDDGRLEQLPFAHAIRSAIDDGVDILNISAGLHYPKCRGDCPYCYAVQQAIDEDITVIAAAGNQYPDADSETVNCPATLEDVIAVGGFVAKCTAVVDETKSDSKSPHPRGAYWVRKREGEDYDQLISEGIFCGQCDCSGSQECIRHNREIPWDANVSPANNKPDVLAPVHYPSGGNGDAFLNVGSSFSAPIVSGTLAGVLGELVKDGIDIPTPYTLRQAIRKNTVRIDEGHLEKLNVTATLNYLVETTMSAKAEQQQQS